MLRSLVAHSLAIVAATIVFPVLAAWILSVTNSLTTRYYDKVLGDADDLSTGPRSPFYAVITTSMLPPVLHEFEKLTNRTFDDKVHRSYLAPYVIPPIPVADDDSDDVWSDEEDNYWDRRHRHDNSALVEGLASLRAAEQFRSSGKDQKAQRLFDHAMSLAPTHPDVLAQYGLFAEESKKDLVNADFYYTRALLYRPDHALARTRRKHTLPLVRDIDSRMLNALDQKRQRFLRIPRDTDGFHSAARDAYVRHIYHTVAIEGNTMTLTQTKSILQNRLAIGGKSVVEHNEILGVDAALRYINSSLVYRRVDSLSVDDIMEIHRRVLGFVDPIEAGRFRRTQVYVGRFAPPPADDVPSEMHDLMSWLRAETTMRNIHPVELAALMHYKLVAIHPFVDGNGRTARLLMNLILMQAGYPPVVIRFTDRQSYYETLKAANDGDLRPFIRFIARCTDRTLDEYLVRLATCGTRTVSSTDVILESEKSLADARRTFNSNILEDTDTDGWSGDYEFDSAGGVIDLENRPAEISSK